MNAALVRHQVRRHRVVLVLVVLGLALFQFLFTRVAPSPEETARFTAMLQFLPANVRDAIGLEGAATVTSRGVLRFGYVHPFTVLLLALWTVRVACSGLAGEIGEGTMDLLASRPVGRAAVVGSVALVLAGGLVLAALAALAGTTLGVATRDLGDVRAAEHVRVVAELLLLYAAWGGIALAVAAAHRRGGGAIAIIAAVMAATFALDYIGRLYGPLKPFRPLSPFMYYAPHQHAMSATGVAVLGGVAVAGTLAALVIFRRRDL